MFGSAPTQELKQVSSWLTGKRPLQVSGSHLTWIPTNLVHSLLLFPISHAWLGLELGFCGCRDYLSGGSTSEGEIEEDASGVMKAIETSMGSGRDKLQLDLLGL